MLQPGYLTPWSAQPQQVVTSQPQELSEAIEIAAETSFAAHFGWRIAVLPACLKLPSH